MRRGLARNELAMSVILVVMSLCAMSCQPAVLSTGIAQNAPAEHEVAQDSSANEGLPPALLGAYEAFADAAKAEDLDRILQSMLPEAIIIQDPRDPRFMDARAHYDSYLPQRVAGASFEIAMVRRQSEDTWLIRNGTFDTLWVRTASEGWKLYQYWPYRRGQ